MPMPRGEAGARPRVPGAPLLLEGDFSHALVVLAVRRPLTLTMTGRGRRNRDASDHEPHVVLDVRMIQVQLQQCRCPALTSFKIRYLESLDIDQLVLLVDVQRRGIPGGVGRRGKYIGHAHSAAADGDSGEKE
jgi:hypothetical protein